MTIPDFQLDKIEDFLFTLDEMKLVNQIGNAYSLSGDNEKAADIFYRLLQYIRRHLPETVTSNRMLATVYKGNIIKNLIMDCQSYTKYRPNETTGGIFVSWRRKEELPTGA